MYPESFHSNFNEYLSKERLLEFIWLLPALSLASFTYCCYIATHPYPAFGGGLFLSMAEQIAKHGYRFPRTVPQYTASGVPFAYPPLVFYCLAVIHGILGVDLFTLTRFLPGLITIGSLVPFYFVSKELLQTPRRAGLASFVLAATPAFVRWHFSAGGIVRAPAFLFSLAGLYTALRLCKTTSWRWIPPTVIWFTLTALTHPEYAVFLTGSIILFTAMYARTVRGFAYASVVGLCGFLLTFPWWGRIISIYSFENIVSASSTHGGLGGGFSVVMNLLGIQTQTLQTVASPTHLPSIFLLSLWYVIPVVGVAYLLVTHRNLLPIWLLLIGVVTGELRFIFTIGSLVTSVFILDGVVPWITERVQSVLSQKNAFGAVLLILALLGTTLMTFYAAGAITDYGGSNSMPSFIDKQDYAAMQWTQRNTDSSAEFLVLGDAAEWFPYVANRTNVVGPWGVEWERSPVTYRWQYSAYQGLSASTTVEELDQKIALTTTTPEYIYVPKGTYTVYGRKYNQQRSFIMELSQSNEYHRVHQNKGVVIFERTTNISVPQSRSESATTPSMLLEYA